MKHRLWIAALALLIPATPALADWGATKWGMSLKEVLRAVPDARPLKREGSGSDVWKQQRLASTAWRDADIDLIADFHFDPDAHKLTLVRSQPKDVADCPKLRNAMIARYGPGTATDEDFPAAGLTLSAVDWTDPATNERLIYLQLNKTGQAPNYCHFIQQMPGLATPVTKRPIAG